jgi:hypothetical protein
MLLFEEEDCPNCRAWEICDPNCKPRNKCTEKDKGLFVEVILLIQYYPNIYIYLYLI